MVEIGKTIIFIGLFLVMVGFLVLLLGRLSPMLRLPAEGLPGDIYMKKGNFTFYFPLATCIILSLVLSLIMFFISRK